MKILWSGAEVALLMLLVVAHVGAAEVTLRADNWYPFNGDPHGAKPGYVIDIAKKILNAAGHSLNYETQPWQRAIEETRKGNTDCVIGAYKEDVPDFVFPTEPIGKVGQTFYVKKSEPWRYTGDLKSLDKISIGVIGGYVYSDEFTRYLAGGKSNVEEIKADNALEQNLKKVAAGRITATIETQYVAEVKIREMGLISQIESAGNLAEPAPIYIACSPAKSSSVAYAQLFSEGIKAMRANGELQAILEKYGLKDWQ